MSAPAIGALGRRLALEAPVARADGMLAYEERAFVWAAIERATARIVIRLRARDDIAAGWRLRDGSRLFEIVSVERDERRSGFVACVCREFAP